MTTPQNLEQPAPTAYEQDFVAWTLDTARLLRAGRLSTALRKCVPK
jgi:hypothetical protein